MLPGVKNWMMRGIEFKGNRMDVKVTGASAAEVVVTEGTISVC